MNIKGLSVPNLAQLFSGNAVGQDAETQPKASNPPAQNPFSVDRFEKASDTHGLQASCKQVSAGAALLINLVLVCPSNGSMTGKWTRPSGIRPQNPNVEKPVRGLV